MLTVKASREQVSTHCISSYHEDSFDQNTLASVTAQVIPRKSVTLDYSRWYPAVNPRSGAGTCVAAAHSAPWRILQSQSLHSTEGPLHIRRSSVR